MSSCNQQQPLIVLKRWLLCMFVLAVILRILFTFVIDSSTILPKNQLTQISNATTTGRHKRRIPFTIKKNLLNDQTVNWDPSIDRMWLDPKLLLNTQKQRHNEGTNDFEEDMVLLPKAMILLTSYGWNQKDQRIALSQYARQTRESELLDGIVNHPYFHPTLWNDLEESPSSSTQNTTIQSIIGLENTDLLLRTRYYIFLDVSSDCEVHYPKYHSFDENLDSTGGRVNHTKTRFYLPQETLHHPVWDSIFIQQLTSIISGSESSANITSLHQLVKLIYFDCTGEMHPNFKQERIESGKPVVVAHMTSTISRSDETIDMGLVPPLLYKDAALSETEIQDIYSCAADYNETKRPYYVTYIGNYRVGSNGDRFRSRVGFSDLHDNNRMFSLRYFLDEFKESSIANVSYDQILKRSIYSGTPRGDNKYSYRFTEVLASGGIPLLISDDWMLPFRPELVNWEECAIIVPEKDAGLAILKYIAPITLSERCMRRQKCYDIYHKYIETGRKVIKAIVDGLELVAIGQHAKMASIHCDQNEPPDSVECNPL